MCKTERSVAVRCEVLCRKNLGILGSNLLIIAIESIVHRELSSTSFSCSTSLQAAALFHIDRGCLLVSLQFNSVLANALMLSLVESMTWLISMARCGGMQFQCCIAWVRVGSRPIWNYDACGDCVTEVQLRAHCDASRALHMWMLS